MGRRWTLRDVAARAGLSVGSVHAAEAGTPISLDAYARLATALGLRPVLTFEDRSSRARADRTNQLQDEVHAAMGELEARQLSLRGYSLAIDEPYQHYQFAGRADLLAWDLGARALLHVENKSRLSDIQDLAGSYNAKRTYLAAVMADRLAVGPAGWRAVTHALVVLWSSEVLHILRKHQATFDALCPSGLDPFRAWWNGEPLQPGVTSSLVLFDPAPNLTGRMVPFVGRERVASVDPRYRDYAAAAATLRLRGAASRR